MFSAFSKTLGQMTDPRFMSVLIKSLLTAIGIFILTWMVIWSALGAVVWTELPFFIGDVITWMGDTFDFLAVSGGIVISIVLTYFLFPAVMTASMGIFLDDVCEAVEEKHYPLLGKARDTSTVEAIINALKFLGIVVAVNIIALPFYVMTFWILGLGLVLYYLINGYLMGREYFEQVAHRRMLPNQARKMRKKNSGTVMLLGFICAFMMTIPFLNLLTPLVATAMMSHLFMKMAEKEGGFDDGASVIEMTGRKDLIENQ
ncbi:EI24 domain-containing protein [Curvivirga sp.]|uniref:EI24 domain-containing protein n=1 Tax=Curvivirga sp. TaxID=2856848 RepID=UPI003B5C5748